MTKVSFAKPNFLWHIDSRKAFSLRCPDEWAVLRMSNISAIIPVYQFSSPPFTFPRNPEPQIVHSDKDRRSQRERKKRDSQIFVGDAGATERPLILTRSSFYSKIGVLCMNILIYSGSIICHVLPRITARQTRHIKPSYRENQLRSWTPEPCHKTWREAERSGERKDTFT